MRNLLTSLVKKYAPEVDYLEIRIEESEETLITFKGKPMDALRQSCEKGGCIRALYKGAWGFTTFNSLDEERLHGFFRSAIKQARLSGDGVSQFGLVPVIDKVVALNLITDPRNVSLEKKVSILRAYNEQILGTDSKIPMSTVSYSDLHKHIWLVTSEGTFLEQERIDLSGNLVAVAVKQGQTQMSAVGFGSSNDFHVIFNHEEDLAEACQNAIALLDAPSIEGGIYTVVADPKLAGVFVHEAFGHTSEGEKVYENKKLAEIMKIGEIFGSPILTIYDSGLDVGCRGFLEYDDEGVLTQKTDLIREGVLTGRLHSRETSGKMSETPTGNGRALNYKFAPIPRMRNTCIAQGQTPVEDLFKGIRNGVYAVDAMGGQGGEMFSFTAGRGYRIRDGQIGEMVKNVTVSGNLFETLKKIDAIGNDFMIHDSGGGCGKGAQFPLPVSSGSPSIRIQDVVIAGK